MTFHSILTSGQCRTDFFSNSRQLYLYCVNRGNDWKVNLITHDWPVVISKLWKIYTEHAH